MFSIHPCFCSVTNRAANGHRKLEEINFRGCEEAVVPCDCSRNPEAKCQLVKVTVASEGPGGKKAQRDPKIYRHKAHKEHLRGTVCREDNSEIRDSFSNEEKRGLAKGGEKKERITMKKELAGKSWMNFCSTHTLSSLYSPWSVLKKSLAREKIISGFLMS